MGRDRSQSDQRFPVVQKARRRLRSQNILRTTCPLMVCCALLMSCQQSTSARQQGNVDSVNREQPHRDNGSIIGTSDLSGSDTFEQLQDVSKFERLLAYVEIENQRFRSEWLIRHSQHIDVSERNVSLIRAAHLRPAYPIDLVQWVHAEASPNPNGAGVTHDAIASWFDRYKVAREDFWSDKQTSDYERRLLWYGEIRNKILDVPAKTARQEHVDLRTIVEEIEDFVRYFPRPLDPTDVQLFRDRIEKLWVSAVLLASNTRFPAVDLNLYEKRIRSVSQEVDDALASVNLHELSRTQSFSINRDYQSKGQAEYDERLLPFLLLTTFSSERPSKVQGGMFIYWHNKLLGMRKIKEYGQLLWTQSLPHALRQNWYLQAIQQLPWYVYVADVHSASAIFSRPALDGEEAKKITSELTKLQSGDGVDMDSLYRWLEWRVQLSEDFKTQRMSEARYDVWVAQLHCKFSGSNKVIFDAFDNLLDLHTTDKTEENWYAHDRAIRSMVRSLRDVPGDFCLTRAEAANVLETVAALNDDGLSAIINGELALSELRETGLEFSSATIDGDKFNITNLRGRFVLLHFWSTNCASCIDDMPFLHELFVQKRSHGLEIVSVCIDATSNSARVRRLISELGLTWTVLNAESEWAELNSRYGWGNVVSQYLLIDRDGKLVADTRKLATTVEIERAIQAVLDEQDGRSETAD